MTKIIAVAGRKFSGKSSLCSYIQAYLVKNHYNKHECGKMAPQGHFPLPKVTFGQTPTGEIKWYDSNTIVLKEMTTEIAGMLGLPPAGDLHIAKVYNFADALKNLCIDLLGIKWEQVWGTEEQKNSLTQFKWENLPPQIRHKFAPPVENTTKVEEEPESTGHPFVRSMNLYNFDSRFYVPDGERTIEYPLIGFRSGFMTAREIMQVVGTDIMRDMFYQNVWVDSTIRAINKEQYPVALIADMRFQTEVKAIHEAGGYIIRLERAVHKDTHKSEVDLDEFPWNEYPRTLVIPAEADLNEKNRIAIEWLKSNIF